MSGLKSKVVTPLYFMQQGQAQIMQYNQMGHTATWQESSMEIKKDAECWFLGNIYKMNWQFHSVKVAMLGINRSRNKLSGHHWALQHVLFWPVFNKYVHKINKGREMQSDIKVTLYCLSATVYVFFKILSSCYFILYSTTLGAKQTYGTSVWLVFPDLGSIWTALIELGVLLIPAQWKKTWKLDKWPQYFHLFVWLLLFLTHSLFYLKIVKIHFPHLWFILGCNLWQELAIR